MILSELENIKECTTAIRDLGKIKRLRTGIKSKKAEEIIEGKKKDLDKHIKRLKILIK